ncbi:DgyrCDS12526 [Dimorphilus gyrociliatus]|uniref:DgyrCDS12526 n=1 Tax=Dimorphilus gyrociliatus TaxID=2664684 RepID=A0A7I8W6R4_9ANNE|nr:DgyrCDS12526 [Dimorphilus gyrociliatus]
MDIELSFWKILLIKIKLSVINWFGRFCEQFGLIINPLTWDDILSSFDKKDQKGANSDVFLENQKKIINEIRLVKSKAPVRFREGIKYNIRRVIKQRLLMNKLILEDPSIFKIPIVKPVFIIGLPKADTTLLHNIFGLNAKFRVPLAYELRNYSEITSLAIDKDPVYHELNRLIICYKSCISSNYCQMKNMRADKPEECHLIFEHLGLIFEYVYAFSPSDMLTYKKFMKATLNDKPYQFDIYNYYKQIIQMILRNDQDRTKRFVASSSIHLLYLPILVKLFPDAHFILIHRNVYQCILSLCLELEIFLKEDWMINSDHIGRSVLAHFSDYSRIGLRNRRFLEDQGLANRFIDVDYENLKNCDTNGTIQEIYKKLEENISVDDMENLTNFMEEYKGKDDGVESSSLDKFGLTYDKVGSEMVEYIDFMQKLCLNH